MFENLIDAKVVLNRKDFQRLHGEMMEVIKDFKRCEARVVRKLQEIDENLVYRFIGYNSLFKYAVEALRLSESQAYAYVAVARKSAKFPALQAAIESGDLSVSKAVRITSVIDDENQADWVDLAIKGGKREVEQAVAGAKPGAVQTERVRFIDSHVLNLNLSISEEAYLKLERARELVSQSTSAHASLTETLVSALDCFLKHKDPLLKKDRKKKTAPSNEAAQAENLSGHLEQQETKTDSITNSSTLPGQGNSDAQANRPDLSEDQKQKAKHVTQSQTAYKPIPRSLKNQVIRRDQARCQKRMPSGEICGERQWLDIHQVIHRAHGGEDRLENLVVLCRLHHQAEHLSH